MWFQWLEAKYASDAALKTAWGTGWQTGDSVVTFNSNMKIYDAWTLDATDVHRADTRRRAPATSSASWLRRSAATYQRRFDNLRALGYPGRKSSHRLAGRRARRTAAANQWTNDAGDAIDRHAYMGGSIGGYFVATGTGL